MAQRWNSLKSTLLNASSDMWIWFAEFLYLHAVEFNLMQRRSLTLEGQRESVEWSDQKTNLQGSAIAVLHTCLYLPSKSIVNVCLHCFVQSSSLNWMEIMLFHSFKTRPRKWAFVIFSNNYLMSTCICKFCVYLKKSNCSPQSPLPLTGAGLTRTTAVWRADSSSASWGPRPERPIVLRTAALMPLLESPKWD